MRAVVVRKVGGPEVVEVLEVPSPEPGPLQVRIKVVAAALNPADAAVWAGIFGSLEGWNMPVSGWTPLERSRRSARACCSRSERR
jgi:NADPH:quinone reductase-like Zn-dependent oxidoreductase